MIALPVVFSRISSISAVLFSGMSTRLPSSRVVMAAEDLVQPQHLRQHHVAVTRSTVVELGDRVVLHLFVEPLLLVGHLDIAAQVHLLRHVVALGQLDAVRVRPHPVGQLAEVLDSRRRSGSAARRAANGSP